MILEINEMIDFIDDFYTGDTKEMVIGGIAGTEINTYAIEGCTKYTKFNKILVIEGCQDYIGLLKNPIDNVMHWSDLFVEEIVPPLVPFDPWKPRCVQENPTFVNRLNVDILTKYEKIIAFDSHLIPYEVKKLISDTYKGQILWVIDPVEAMNYFDESLPIIVDTLRKVSPIIAMARQTVGVETRAVDTKIRGSINETSKINKRSIGKIDDKQYITNDFELYNEIINRQKEIPFRKNQKVIVEDDLVDMMTENGVRKASLARDSMLVIENANSKPLMKLRLYNSKITYYADISYETPLHHIVRGKIRVRPANIITVALMKYHRYNHTILVLAHPLNPAQKYSVLKNSNNVTLVDKSNKYK